MINKEKTIKKAISRYNLIYPVRGKKLIEECFFCLRGEYFLIFRTKDKKIHKMRADELRPPLISSDNKHDGLHSLIDALNKPIIVRSIFAKKPVKACLINLFPVPAISWSANSKNALSGKISTQKSILPSIDRSRTGTQRVVKPTAEETAMFSKTSVHQVVPHGQRNVPPNLTGENYPSMDNTASYNYEILATGCLPVHPFNEWMPALDETSVFTKESIQKIVNSQNGPDQEFVQMDQTASYHYEVLATGCLPISPIDNERLSLLDETLEHSYIPTNPIASRHVGPVDLCADQNTPIPMNTGTHQIDGNTHGYLADRPNYQWESVSNRVVTGYLHKRPEPQWDMTTEQTSEYSSPSMQPPPYPHTQEMGPDQFGVT